MAEKKTELNGDFNEEIMQRSFALSMIAAAAATILAAGCGSSETGQQGAAPKAAGQNPAAKGGNDGQPRSLAAEANPPKPASAQPPAAKAAPAPVTKASADAAEMEDPIEPYRGKSMTWDSEVSRLLSGGLGPRVTVLRGRSVDVRAVKNSTSSSSGSEQEKSSASEDSGKDPEEADGESAE